LVTTTTTKNSYAHITIYYHINIHEKVAIFTHSRIMSKNEVPRVQYMYSV